MFLRRSLVHISYMYMIFFFRYSPPPPPHTKKLATLLLPAFAHQKSGQMKMADSVPPPLATRNRRHCLRGFKIEKKIGSPLRGLDNKIAKKIGSPLRGSDIKIAKKIGSPLRGSWTWVKPPLGKKLDPPLKMIVGSRWIMSSFCI